MRERLRSVERLWVLASVCMGVRVPVCVCIRVHARTNHLEPSLFSCPTALQWPPQTTVKPPAPPLPPSPSLLLANRLPTPPTLAPMDAHSAPSSRFADTPAHWAGFYPSFPLPFVFSKLIPSSCALDSSPRASQEPSRIAYSSSLLFPSPWNISTCFHLSYPQNRAALPSTFPRASCPLPLTV